jgi:hypothetical protein
MRRNRAMHHARCIFPMTRIAAVAGVGAAVPDRSRKALRLWARQRLRQPAKRRLSRGRVINPPFNNNSRVVCAWKQLPRVASSPSRRCRRAIVRAAVVGVAVARGPKVRWLLAARPPRLRRAKAQSNSSSAASAARVGADALIDATVIANARTGRGAISGARAKAAKAVATAKDAVASAAKASNVRASNVKAGRAITSGAIVIVDRGAARAASLSARAATVTAAGAVIGATSRRQSSIPSSR